MKAYKGFDKNLKCCGFQYEIGKEYREESAKLCNSGFHACENPLDTFGHYSPGAGSRYCEVELEEVSDERRSDDTKVCGKVIKIGTELSVAEICKAHFEYVKARCIPANSNAAGDRESAAAGVLGSASAGKWGSAAAGVLGSAAAGSEGSASAGYRGSASAGNRGSAAAGVLGSAAAGSEGSAAAGYRGSASAGKWGSASAGYRGSASAGKNGIACCRGGKVKGGLGCAICCAEVDDEGNNIGIAAAIVDGEKIKANTWYTVKNGEFVMVSEEKSK